METELANIIDVPVLHAGEFVSHNAGPLAITEEELDEIVENSNRLQPIIKEAIETGEYRGNPELTEKLSKAIPGLLNLQHQEPFRYLGQVISPEAIKEATKGITTTFRKALVNGKNWIVQQFQNVPDDVAKAIKEDFPFRSVELLPLKDPDTGKFSPKTIRSTAFLNKFTPPAVSGQNANLIVEFAAREEPLTIITTTGVNTMLTPNEEKPVGVSELQKMQETLAAQNQALAELQSKFDASEAEKAKAIELAREQEKAKDAQIAELQAKQATIQAEKYLTELSRLRKKGENTFQVKPAFIEIVKPIIEGNGVIELAEGQSQQEAMFKLFDEIAELGDVTLQLSLEGEKSYSPPDQKPNKEDMIKELMDKEGITESQAWIKATEALGEYKVEVQYG